MVIHAVDQEAPLQEDADRPYTHLSPRGAFHILLRALYQDLQKDLEGTLIISVLQDVADQVLVVDLRPDPGLTHAPLADHLVQQEAHHVNLEVPEFPETDQDPIQNPIRAHLAMTSPQHALIDALDQIRAPHLQLVANQSVALVRITIIRTHVLDRVPNHLPDQLVGHQ